MAALEDFTSEQFEATLRALRSLAERMAPGVMPAITVPFAPDAELAAVRAMIDALLDDAPLEVLGDLAIADDFYPPEIRAVGEDLANAARRRRGVQLAVVAAEQSVHTQLHAYLFVVASIAAIMPYEELTDATREAYVRMHGLETGGAPSLSEQMALEVELATLGAALKAHDQAQVWDAATTPERLH